jgi:hypothetical protein
LKLCVRVRPGYDEGRRCGCHLGPTRQWLKEDEARCFGFLGQPTDAREGAPAARFRSPARGEKKQAGRLTGPPAGKYFLSFFSICFSKPFSKRISNPNQIK